MALLLFCSFDLLHQLAETLGVVDGHVGQHLAGDIDAGLLQLVSIGCRWFRCCGRQR